MENDGIGNITIYKSLKFKTGIPDKPGEQIDSKIYISDQTRKQNKVQGDTTESKDLILDSFFSRFTGHVDTPYGSINSLGVISYGGHLICDKADGGIIGLGWKNGGARFYFRSVPDKGIVFGQNDGNGDYPVYIKTLYVNGQLYTSSDYRLKSNVRDIEEITTLNLRPVQYEMQENHRIGLIAHEVQEQIPYVVTGEKDGKEMQSVNYIDLIPVLIKDIQRLSKKNADLEERILRLESLLLDNSRTR